MQIDAYMILESKGLRNIEDGPIPGETTDQELLQRKAIEITSYSLSGSCSYGDSDEPREIQVSNKPRIYDNMQLSVNKTMDSSSPILMIAYCSHLSTSMKEAKPFPKLTLVVRKAGDIQLAGGEHGPTKKSQTPYLRMIFQEVYLTGYSCGGEHGSNTDMPTEALEFRFKEFSMEYWPQSATGQQNTQSATTMAWDFYKP